MSVQLTLVYIITEHDGSLTRVEFVADITQTTTYAQVFQMVLEKNKIKLSATSKITTPKISRYGDINLGTATPEFCGKSILEHVSSRTEMPIRENDDLQLQIAGVISVKSEDTEILAEDDEGYFESLLGNASYVRAAKAIQTADVILFTTGAGWSADSGLATYPGVADIEPYRKRKLTYYDICQPQWRTQEPETFYGFWGDCTNVYRSTPFHGGYHIAIKWKERIMNRSRHLQAFAEWHSRCPDKERVTNIPFFSLTSNVDAHWWNPNLNAVCDRKEVYEIHGNVENWQCADKKNCKDQIWALDNDFVFDVNQSTMLAQEPYPKCPECNAPARPSILMFADWQWNEPEHDEARWLNWKQMVQQIAEQDPDINVAIIEIGAGQRVPSIRMMSEKFCAEPGNRTLIRINPDKSCLTSRPRSMIGYSNSDYITIDNKGFDALKKLDALIEYFDENEGTN